MATSNHPLPPGVVGPNVYFGLRYIPKFADSPWDINATYEPLTIVSYQGNSYTSRTFVPAGIDISNTLYWAPTGNYNAQVESLREQVNLNTSSIQQLEDDIARIPAHTLYASKSENFKADVESGEYSTVIVDKDVEIVETVNPPSGITIRGCGGKIIARGVTPFKPVGSISLLTTIPGQVAYAASSATVLDASGIRKGDSLYLLGSESLINNPNIPDEWSLGSGTASITSAPLAANVVVNNVSDNVISFAPEIPWYMGANVGVYKWNPARNVVFENLEFDVEALLSIQFTFADTCRVSNCSFKLKGPDGYGAIMAVSSTNLRISSNQVNIADTVAPTYYNNNYIRFTGCNRCTIEGNDLSHGGQPIDITFNSVAGVSYNCIVAHNKIDALASGMTVHPGSFACTIANNIIYTKGQGVFARCRNHVIIGNSIFGNGASFGIVSSEGFGSGIIVTGNLIYNFEAALSLGGLSDNRGFAKNFTYTFTGNTMQKCRKMCVIYQGENSVNARIVLQNNHWSESPAASSFETVVDMQGDPAVTVIVTGNTIYDLPELYLNDGANNSTILVSDNIISALTAVLSNNSAPVPNIKLRNNVIYSPPSIPDAFAYNYGELPSRGVAGDVFVTSAGPQIWYSNAWHPLAT